MGAYGIGSQLTLYRDLSADVSLAGGDSTADGYYQCEFTGGGSVGVRAATQAGNRVLYSYPTQSTGLPTVETHSSNILTTNFTAQDVQFSVMIRGLRHTRNNYAPNNWEKGAWMFWRYEASGDYHYYVALKRSNIEIGRTNVSPQQTILSTNSAFKGVLGRWYFLEVKHVGDLINVWVDGVQYFTNFNDSGRPAGNAVTGKIGFYQEDAEAEFKKLRAQAL